MDSSNKSYLEVYFYSFTAAFVFIFFLFNTVLLHFSCVIEIPHSLFPLYTFCIAVFTSWMMQIRNGLDRMTSCCGV